MKKKGTIINRMLNILAEANDLDSGIIDHFAFRNAYERAANELNYEESEDGENDLFKFTYRLGNRYFWFYKKLRPILIAEGLTTLEQREEFIRKTFVLK